MLLPALATPTGFLLNLFTEMALGCSALRGLPRPAAGGLAEGEAELVYVVVAFGGLQFEFVGSGGEMTLIFEVGQSADLAEVYEGMGDVELLYR